MGLLKDKAKAASKFFILEKGESAVVKFLSAKFIPNELDPTSEVLLVEVEEGGKSKFWKTANTGIWSLLDPVQKGDYIQIAKHKKINKNTGVEDTGKSRWEVTRVDAPPQAVAT